MASVKRESIEWCNVWVPGADRDDLPRILLAGDSITQSYFPGVEKALEGRFRVARLTTSRCAGDPQLKRELAMLLAEFRFAAIHFNNGLHGWDFTEHAYARGLARTLDYLKARMPETTVMWASTTPVWLPNGTGRSDDAKTARVRERNRLAQALAAERGIPVNDLFSRVIDQPGLVSPDGVHFKPEGQEALARQVADFILRSLTVAIP